MSLRWRSLEEKEDIPEMEISSSPPTMPTSPPMSSAAIALHLSKTQVWIIDLTQAAAIDYRVERGIHELTKLGIESQLWEASRREIDDSVYHKTRADLDF